MHYMGCAPTSPSVRLGLIVSAERYRRVYCIQSPCVSSVLHEGVLCVVFKMALQPNTCKLLIQCLAPCSKNTSTCLDLSWVKLLYGHRDTVIAKDVIAILHNHKGILIIVLLTLSVELLDYVEQMETRDFNIV